MASKIKLGKRPKSFKSIVKFLMLDGTEAAIEITYKYRTRAEFGKFIDDVVSSATPGAASVPAVEASVPVGDEAASSGDGAAVLDDAVADEAAAAAHVEFSMARLMEMTAGANVEYVMDAVEGWNLDEPFNKENVARLANEFPAAIAAILDGYRKGCVEGRLGN